MVNLRDHDSFATVNRIDAIASEARGQGLNPWILVKERLSRLAIEILSASGDGAVLQGGAALHFAYGSTRLSSDVDFVGLHAGQEIARHGVALAAAAQELLDCPSQWSIRQAGRLTRGKVTLATDGVRRLVLPIEAFDIPSHFVRRVAGLGAVEEPLEIAADKIVASADRFARRGTLKTTDLYDLWFVCAKLAVTAPDASLIAQKLADYDQPLRHADLAAAVREISPEELRAALAGVLPSHQFSGLDLTAMVAFVATLLGGYRDVL